MNQINSFTAYTRHCCCNPQVSKDFPQQLSLSKHVSTKLNCRPFEWGKSNCSRRRVLALVGGTKLPSCQDSNNKVNQLNSWWVSRVWRVTLYPLPLTAGISSSFFIFPVTKSESSVIFGKKCEQLSWNFSLLQWINYTI